MASPHYQFVFLFFSHLIITMPFPSAGGSQGDYYCPPSSSCGYLGNITFPFTIPEPERLHCGLLPIHNCDDPFKQKTIQLQKKGKSFEVLQLSPFPYVSSCIFRDKELYGLLQSRNCEAFRHNYTLPPSTAFPYVSINITSTETLFRCNRTLHVQTPSFFHKYTNCSDSDYDLYYRPLVSAAPGALKSCTKVQLPIKDLADSNDPFTFITADIYTQVTITEDCVNCHLKKRGRCQLDSSQRLYCANEKNWWNQNAKLIIIVALVAIGVAVLVVLACCYRTKIFPPTFLLFRKENPTHQIIEEFLKEHGPLPATRYSYPDVKKITNSFKNKLGQGGYGSVYKGELHDGRIVAVKVLSESKGNGEDFINEVASISRTSHVNIVRLIGYCLDGSKKALICEFMPNGSLEKFIYEEKNTLKEDHQLNCKTLYDIAIGVARGLEYLHRGCNTRILHFDIKPHNILLDQDFCPKIADFGLSRICLRKESIVSTFGARGTAGYIAPELFSRNFGGVSHKSDVYSYGMVVLEMVGQRKNIKVEVDRSSELYFPHWIYKRLELNQDLGLQCIGNEIDEELVRKMTVVSLWCIQTNPSNRPAMHKVVEMLEGSLQVLEIPPKPFLSSPSTSPAHLSSEIL